MEKLELCHKENIEMGNGKMIDSSEVGTREEDDGAGGPSAKTFVV